MNVVQRGPEPVGRCLDLKISYLFQFQQQSKLRSVTSWNSAILNFYPKVESDLIMQEHVADSTIEGLSE